MVITYGYYRYIIAKDQHLSLTLIQHKIRLRTYVSFKQTFATKHYILQQFQYITEEVETRLRSCFWRFTPIYDKSLKNNRKSHPKDFVILKHVKTRFILSFMFWIWLNSFYVFGTTLNSISPMSRQNQLIYNSK